MCLQRVSRLGTLTRRGVPGAIPEVGPEGTKTSQLHSRAKCAQWEWLRGIARPALQSRKSTPATEQSAYNYQHCKHGWQPVLAASNTGEILAPRASCTAGRHAISRLKRQAKPVGIGHWSISANSKHSAAAMFNLRASRFTFA